MIAGELCIYVWDNLDAEDDLSNSLGDASLLSDLILIPIRNAVAEYLRDNYGRYLDIDVEVVR